MSDINQVCVSGRLTRDAELRVTQTGVGVLGFSLAVGESRKNQTGQWEDYTNFLDVTVIGKRAEPLQRFLAKGMQVTVSGKLRWSQWEKDGSRRSKVEIMADNVVLPPKKGEQVQQVQQVQSSVGYEKGQVYDEFDECPF